MGRLVTSSLCTPELCECSSSTYLMRTWCAVSDSGSDSEGARPAARKHAPGHASKRSKRKEAAVHPITVWTESDIFKGVGLTYVPPFLRTFKERPW